MILDFNYNNQNLFVPLMWFLGGLFLGVIIEKILLKKLQNAVNKTKWKGDDVIIGSFKGIVIFLTITAGIYFSAHHLSLKDSVIHVLDKIVFSVVVISFSVLIGRILVGFIKIKTSGTAGLLPSSSIIANITRIIVLLVGILVILQTLGISVTPVLTALGVGGLAVALALQDTLSNLFSGIQVIASQQIRTGDYIKLNTGEEGYISDITWRNTIIRTLPNNLIIVPNAKVASAIITNYYLPDKELAVLVDVGVSYDSDLSKVEQVTIQTAKEVMNNVEGGVKKFEAFIRYNSFADSSINFSVIMRAQEFTDQYLIKHEFIKALHKSFHQNAIEIPFPIRTIISKNFSNK